MPHLFIQDLTHIDCSLLDRDRGLAGASWIVDVELLGGLDEQSMVLDFSKVKKQIKSLIDEHVDHKLLIPVHDQQLVIKQENKLLVIQFTDRQNELILHSSPSNAVTLIETEQITTAAITDFLITLIQPTLPDNIDELRISLREEIHPASYYCYSHGLKKHDGNCQRIAHGHRSKIVIWKNNQRNAKLEEEFANSWQDIYLGSEADVIENNADRIRFQYTAPQGEFMIELPTKRVHLVPDDSTVECLAEHICELISTKHPNSAIKIQAFEGVNKGAIAETNS